MIRIDSRGSTGEGVSNIRCACVGCACKNYCAQTQNMSGVVLYAGRWFSCLPLVVRTLEAQRDNFVAPLRFRVVVAAFGRVPVAWERETSIEALMTTVLARPQSMLSKPFATTSAPTFSNCAEWSRCAGTDPNGGDGEDAQVPRLLVPPVSPPADRARPRGRRFRHVPRARPDWRPSPGGRSSGSDRCSSGSRAIRARGSCSLPLGAARDGNFTPPTYDYFFVANHDGMLRATDTNLTRVLTFSTLALVLRCVSGRDARAPLANAAIGLVLECLLPSPRPPADGRATCAAARNYTVPSCPLPAPSMSSRHRVPARGPAQHNVRARADPPKSRA